MVKTKYGKYILKDTGGKKLSPAAAGVMPVTLEGLKDWGGVQHRMKWSFISQPTAMFDAPHSHDFDEIFVFLSSDPTNPTDFAAEIELSLGGEQEKQVITSPTVVCLPKGLVHGALHFRAVTKPVLFCQIYLAPEYVEKPAA